MNEKSIPEFKSDAELEKWVRRYCDFHQIEYVNAFVHQAGQYRKLKCTEEEYVAFNKHVRTGAWVWPPLPPKEIP